MDTPSILLTEHDMAFVAKIAAKRHRGPSVVSLHDEAVGVAAELAVARYLGRSWVAYRSDPRGIPADIGDDIEVRATVHDDGGMILHRADPGTHRYVLAHVAGPVVTLVGWEWGHALKIDRWWRPGSQGRSCYLVPSRALRPIEALPVRAAA